MEGSGKDNAAYGIFIGNDDMTGALTVQISLWLELHCRAKLN